MTRPPTFPAMRPQIELQRVHDVLMAVLSSPMRKMVPKDLQKPLAMAADCLCWALHHPVETCPNAANFADLIFWLEHDLADMGIEWGGSAEQYIIEE